MTVLGRGLVFQPVLVTQTCTYNSKYITLTLQIFHQKRERERGRRLGRPSWTRCKRVRVSFDWLDYGCAACTQILEEY